VNSILHLQQTIGNQAVQHLLQTNAEELELGLAGTSAPHYADDFNRAPVHSKMSLTIQAKLKVNIPGDIYAQEADRVAEKAMQRPGPQLQRTCACGGACSKCQAEQPGRGHKRLQTQRVAPGDRGRTEAPAIVHEALRSPGPPIDLATRASMELPFGHDNQPHASTGFRLLAQELTHVVQRSNTAAPDIQMQPGPTFPKKGIQVTGPDAAELVELLSSCTGTQLKLDKSDMLEDTGKKKSSKTASGAAKKQLLSLIKTPNGVIIDTDPNVPGAFVGAFRPAQPGFHNVNVQQIKVLAAASGATGGFEVCSAILHEISEAANARTLDVKGKTPQADIFSLSHDYGFAIENKIRADFKLPARDKSGSMIATLYSVNNSYILSLFSNVFGTGSDLRTQLSVVKTPFAMVNSKPQPQGNEILASHVEMGTVALSTTNEGRDAFKKFFSGLHTQLGLP
jgi:hypothetical protein